MTGRDYKIQLLKQLQEGKITSEELAKQCSDVLKSQSYADIPELVELVELANEMGWEVDKKQQLILMPGELSDSEFEKLLNLVRQATKRQLEEEQRSIIKQ